MAGPVGTWTLTVRVDRPVEGCEINPHVYLYQKGEKGAPPPGQPKHIFIYRWLRGPEHPVCANPDCPRAQSFSPIQWSKFARKGCSFSIQCVSCAKLRVPRHLGVFCTLQCFHDAWKVHKRIHRASRNGDGGDNPAADDEDETPPPPPVDYLTADTTEADWVEVSTERSYAPQGADVGRCLKLEIRVLNPDGSLLLGPRVTETEPVLSAPPAPPPRSMITVKNIAALSGNKFRVATYNVLAEIYATQQMYPYCDHWALSWNYRKSNLIKELREVAADVLFLQEVQADHYELHIMPELNDEGFDGLYKHKTREAMGASGKVDGCAIFWRRNKFRLADKSFLELNDCARRQAAELGFSHDQQQSFLQRLLKDNIAMVAILEVIGRQRGGRHGNNLICMANTHLYSHPEFPDVKLWQCYQLVQWLEGIVMPSNMPLILCGDFNSEPLSAVYQFMAEQVVQHDHPDMSTDPADVVRSLHLHDHQLGHSLGLKSAYSALLGREPKYTNYTVGYIGVLDYVWYTMDHLRPLAVAAVPDEAELLATGEGLPNSQYPSDHLVLWTDLQFTSGTGPGGMGGGVGVLGDVKRMQPGVGMTHMGGGGGTPSKQTGAVLRKDSRGMR